MEAHALVLEWLDFAHQPPGRALGRALARSTERLRSASAAKRATTSRPCRSTNRPARPGQSSTVTTASAPSSPNAPSRFGARSIACSQGSISSWRFPIRRAGFTVTCGRQRRRDDGRPTVLFDPAVSTGHREQDLAMTHLFGGFRADFYDAYEEVYPLTAGWKARQPAPDLPPARARCALRTLCRACAARRHALVVARWIAPGSPSHLSSPAWSLGRCSRSSPWSTPTSPPS